MKAVVVLLLATLLVASATVYFEEKFDDKSWEKRWVKSTAKDNFGKWGWTAGEWYGNKNEDKGLQTSEDARNYAISAKIPTPFTNEGKDLVIQFSVKHPQGIDCGGGYIKVFPAELDQAKLTGDSQYFIMAGPDVCGATRRIHFIFNYKGQNLLWKKEARCETDKLTHLYTFIVHPDNTYEVHVDGEKKESGNLVDDWDFLKPKTIADPSAVKPADWVDQAEIADPEDKKPEGWDNEPETIRDPDATKPDDWDDEEDGEWEAPMIPNPAYKGQWRPRMIPNPAYKGEWKAPQIPNPEYVADDNLYLFKDIGAVGFDLWQVKAGSIFDNVIVTDSVQEAKDFAEATYKKNAPKEKEMYDKIQEEQRKKDEDERKRMEEERKKQEEARKAEEEVDEDEEEEEVVEKAEDEADRRRKEKLESLKNKQAESHDEL